MLTQSSPSSLPKLKHAKSHRTMVISTKPSIPKGRLSSLQNSPVHSNERPVPILSTLYDESPLQMNTNIGWNSHRDVKTGAQTTKNARPVLDEDTLKRIDLLVGTQQGRTSRSPEHSESPPSGGSSSRKFSMKKKTVIMKVKTYMENKGIEGGQKNKQFDRKFDVFRKLPTFVDARRLLKNQSDTLVDMTPQADADSPLFFRQSTGRITVTATNKGRNFAQKRQMTTEFTNESTDLMTKPEGKKGPPGQDEEKRTLVGKLIDHLKSNNAKNFKEENVIDEENTNAKFDRYINKELLDENYNWFHRSQSNPIIFSENKKNDQNTFSITYRDQQSFLPTEKVDPQVQILQQAQKYKEKSEEIIKTLHNTLVHVHKSKMLSESPRQADNFTPSPNEPSVKVTQLTDSTASRISIFKQKSFLVPSLSFKEASSPISVKKGKPSYSKESSPSKQLDRYFSKFIGPASPSPKVPRKISESTNFESPRNPKRMTLKDNTQPEKDMFMNICHQIEDLSATNKDLNKQLKASIKQMDESYLRQTQMFKNFGIPESLQGVTPESSIKSSTKLTRALVDKLYMTEKEK